MEFRSSLDSSPTKEGQVKKKKIFVIDTNVLLHDPNCIEVFGQNIVALGISVIEELDGFKTKTGELGNNARTIIRKLDGLRNLGHLRDGVFMSNGGICKIIAEENIKWPENQGLNPNTLTHKLLRLAFKLHHMNERVILVSKDISTRLKADALGIQVEDYESGKVNTDLLYVGYREVIVEAAVYEKINEQIIRHKEPTKSKGKKEKHKEEEEDKRSDAVEDAPAQDTTEILKAMNIESTDLCSNEFIIVKERQSGRSVTMRWRKMPTPKIEAADAKESTEEDKKRSIVTRLCHLSTKSAKVWNVEARSKEQMMALEMLQDPDIKLVTLIGQAGTGKTLLALASALDQVFGVNRYEKILVTRPIMPLGKDIGYLPGGKDDKLLPWMQPIFDNLDFLVPKKDNRNDNKYALLSELDDDEEEKAEDSTPSTRRRRRRANSQPNKKETEDFDVIQSLTQDAAMAKIQMEAIAYIRGRSIMNQFIIVDECQNLTPHEIKTIISRCGEGTKMVLTGDPRQIDNPYLDANSNGLSYCVEKLKKVWIHGHVTLTSSERSELAAVAASLL